ncbi:MAG: 50S ribosomal protein L22 [Chthoniobacterales bacterium]
MQVRSIYKYARISPFKVRQVTREIQGLPATDALDVLRFTPRKAATLITKTLRSAIANAENNNNVSVESLVVKEAVAGEGPTLKRIRPRARGSASPIHKRSSHIQIILTDEIEIKRREDTNSKKKKASGKPAASKKSAPKEKKSTKEPKAEEPSSKAVEKTSKVEKPAAKAKKTTSEKE